MKRGWRKILIVALGALASLLLFAGCTLGTSLNDIITEHNLTAQITYYANGGKFEKTKDVKNLYYEAGVIPLNIRDDNAVKNIDLKKDGYDLIDWYHAETDDNGELIFEEGSDVPKASDRKADFSQVLKAGEHWTLVAEWKIQSRVRVKVAGELPVGEKITVGEAQYGYGDEIKVYPYENANTVNEPTNMANYNPTNGYSFIQFYSDEACTQLQKWPIERGDEDVYVYARYLAGTWKILDEKSDIRELFVSGVYSSDNYLLIKDVDCTGLSVPVMSDVSGTLKADEGCEIKNLTVTGYAEKQISSTFALFGTINATAKILNVSFENIKFEYTTARLSSEADFDINFYATYSQINAGATVSGVKISGTLSINASGKAKELITVKQENGVWTGWERGEIEAGAEEAANGFDISGLTATVVGDD